MKNIISSAIICAATLLAVSCAKPAEVGLQVKTVNGTVEGFVLDNGVKAFLGIPFAEAPVGDLRWSAPQPKANWDGVLQTKAFGNDPMQPIIYRDMIFRGPERNEDCLYLNVWTNAATVADGLPVLIYFNGGGLMAGSGSEPRYDGAAIAAEGVIGVTANYREGIFGFFAHPELTAESSYNGSGNYGFLDQVAAIDWVKANIAAFGGDPERITIVGESAGSFSVSLLMVSPLSKDKIAGAMLSSGAEVLPNKPVTQEDADAEGAARLAGKGIASIAEARALSAEELQDIFPPAGMAHTVLDGYFMAEAPDVIFAEGRQADVPVLAGWNSLEGSFAGSVQTRDDLKTLLAMRFGDMTEEILEAYGITTDEDVASQKGNDLASDLFTGFPTWKVCDYQATTKNKPVYRYKFNHARPHTVEDPEAPLASGAVHSADIEYAMGNLSTNTVYNWQSEDYEISRIFLSYYANFCKSGNPNGEGLPEWSPLNGRLDDAPVMQIDVVTEEQSSPSTENAYRTLVKFYLNSK